MIRLEKQVKNLSDIIVYPKFDDALLQPVIDPDNKSHAVEFRLKHPELIKWPDHISHTSLDELIQFPIDYVMEHIVHIESTGAAAMSDVKRTKGNVAHAIIEALFKPKVEGGKTKAADVAAVLEGTYDTVFADMVEAKGAILNLDENMIERKLLKVEMRRCLDNLIQILEDNKLSVTGCERRLEQHIRLVELGDDPEVHGIIDMTLEDGLGKSRGV